MAITKQKKKEIIDELTNAVANSQSMVFVNFHGLPVEESTALRGDMHNADVRLRVAKKTLLRRVLEASDVTGEIPALDGEIAVAWSEDLIAPARVAQKFHTTHKEQFSIVGGVFEGRFMSREEMTDIATIPDMPVLRGMFVNVINSPIQGFVVALNAIAEKKA